MANAVFSAMMLPPSYAKALQKSEEISCRRWYELSTTGSTLLPKMPEGGACHWRAMRVKHVIIKDSDQWLHQYGLTWQGKRCRPWKDINIWTRLQSLQSARERQFKWPLMRGWKLWESNQKMWPHGGQAFQSSIQFVTDRVFKTTHLAGLRLVTAVAHRQNDLLTYCFQYFAFWMFFDSTNRVSCKILRGQYVSYIFSADTSKSARRTPRIISKLCNLVYEGWLSWFINDHGTTDVIVIHLIT